MSTDADTPINLVPEFKFSDGWVTPVGIEITWMPARAKRHGSGNFDATAKLRDRMKADLVSGDLGFLWSKARPAGTDMGPETSENYLHIDGQHLELSTRVLYSQQDVVDLWNTVEPIAKKHGAIKESYKLMSGGGHINVNARSRKCTAKLLRDYSQRPYITWAFDDPCNDQWSNNLLNPPANWSDKNARKYLLLSPDHPNFVRVPSTRKFTGLHLRQSLTTGKSHFLEFRGFWAARTLEEQLAHIDFVQGYMRYVQDRPACDVRFRSMADIHRHYTSPDVGSREFKELIETLGLDYARYAEYDDYLRYRIELGPAYMT